MRADCLRLRTVAATCGGSAHHNPTKLRGFYCDQHCPACLGTAAEVEKAERARVALQRMERSEAERLRRLAASRAALRQ